MRECSHIKRLFLLSAFLLAAHVVCSAAIVQGPDSLKSYPGVSIRTNLLLDAVAEPNLGFEVPVGEHVTLGANAGLKSWPRWLAWDWDKDNPTHWRNFLVAPEVRYYLKQVYQGFFLGSNFLYTHYNVGHVKFPLGLYPAANEYRLQGDVLALGLFGGHSWWLGPHWRMEVKAGAAVGYNRAERFECAHCGAKLGDDRGVVIIPQLGLNVAYNFKRRQEKKQEILEILAPAPPVPVPEPQPLQVELPHVEEWQGKAGQLAKQHPVLLPSSEYRPYTPDRILRKEEGALYVFFELGQSQLKRSFTERDRVRDNGPVLDEILHITSSILADTTSAVSCIQIVGLASVEGSHTKNVQLSDERARVLKTYIQERLDVPDALFETVGGAEAWTEFRDIVNDLMLAGGGVGLSGTQLEKVRDILDTEPDPARRERALKTLEGGAVYAKLRETVLADLRNSGYIRVYYDYVPDEQARTINRAIDAIEAGELDQARALAETVKEDPRSQVLFEYFRKWEQYERERQAYKDYLEELKQYNINN